MENEQEHRERSGVMGGVAGVLNAGGSAMVYAYDVTSGAIGKLFSVARKAPVVPVKAFDMVAGGLSIVKPGETRKIEDRIKAYEKKIKGLYYEIGKEGSRYEDIEDPLQTEPVQKLIADVREYEKEIQRLQVRIQEVREGQKEKALRKKEKRAAAKVAAEKTRLSDEEVLKSLTATIEKAARQGVFESSSERAIFDKVATDLLDSEMEIKTLAAAELGKMGNEAAVPILIEAAGFDDPDLISEIINSLISIGAAEAVPLFSEKVDDPQYRVRVGCLRGLFKLADDDDAIQPLTRALRDQHPEVRRTAATFLGWKDSAEAVPALVQCLQDKEARVRKAAVSALANIKDDSSAAPLFRVLGDKELEIREKALEAIRLISGEEIAFDVNASGKELNKAVDELRRWWQEKRLDELDGAEAEEVSETEAAVETEEPQEVTAEAEPAEEMEEPEEVPVEAETVEEMEAEVAAEAEAAVEMEEPQEVMAEAEAAEETEEPQEVTAEDVTLEAEEPDADADALMETKEEEVDWEPVDPSTEAPPAEGLQYSEQSLMKMLKTELLTICEELNIACDETETKAQIAERILEATR